MTIPDRSNSDKITADWFSDIKQELEYSATAVNYELKTADYTADMTEVHIGIDASSNSVQITIPAASGNLGKKIWIKAIDISNAATIYETGNATIKTFSSTGEVSIYVSDGTAWQDFSSASALALHEADTSTHGVGEIVGTTETQTLTNKTLNDCVLGGSTTVVSSTELEIDDANITINKNGNDATSEGAGITVERTGTDGSIQYEDALTSKWKANGVELANISGSQILTNKAISNPSQIDAKKDTEANLVTYASTATNGQFCFATDTKVMYQVVDGSLSEFGGGGGGGGGYDIYGQLDADDTDYTDFDTSGLTNATFGEETTNPLSGLRSYLLTNITGSVNEVLSSPAQTVEDRSTSKFNSAEHMYTYDGDNGDIRAYLYDVTNSAEVIGSSVELGAASAPTRAIPSGFFSDTIASVELRFEILVVNNGKKLIFDDAQFSDAPFVYQNLQEENEFSVRSTDTGAITSQGGLDKNGNNAVASIVDSGNYYTVTWTTDFFSVAPSVVPNVETFDRDFSATDITSTGCRVYIMTSTGSAFVNEPFSLQISRQGDDYNQFSEHVVTPAKSNMTDWEDAGLTTSNFTGFGTVSNIEISKRQDGPDLLLSGRFTVGTVTATEARVALPDSLVSKGVSVIPTMNVAGSWYRGNVSATGKGGATFIEPAKSYFVFGNGYTYSGTDATVDSKMDGNQVLSSGNIVHLEVRIPIEGWSSNATFLAAIPVQQTAYIRDAKASGTNGGTFTSGAWRTRDLTEVTGDSALVTLSANQFTLTAGTYNSRGEAVGYKCSTHAVALYNVTDAIYMEYGINESSAAADTVSTRAKVDCKFTITKTTTFELRHRCSTTKTTTGFGASKSFGVDEVYATVEVTKIK